MAINYTPTTLSGPMSTVFLNELNANFTDLATILERALSRYNDIGNTWEADQDANSNDLNNLGTLNSDVVRCDELYIGGVLHVSEGSGGGVTDHGDLTGLVDDDHTQYHNDARGDARYYTQAQIIALLGDFQTYVDTSDGNLNQAIGDLVTTDLNDVSNTPPSNVGDMLTWNGSQYVPSPAGTVDFSKVQMSHFGTPISPTTHNGIGYKTGFILTQSIGTNKYLFYTPGGNSPAVIIPHPASATVTLEHVFVGQGDRLFASVSNVLYYTDNDGASWTASTGLSSNIFYCATDGAGTLLAIQKNGSQRYYSTDNGVSFTALTSATGSHPTWPGAVTYHAASGVFVGTTSSRLYTWSVGGGFTEVITASLYPDLGSAGMVGSYNGEIFVIGSTRVVRKGSTLATLEVLPYDGAQLPSGVAFIGQGMVTTSRGIFWAMRATEGLIYCYDGTDVFQMAHAPWDNNNSIVPQIGVYNDGLIFCNLNGYFLPMSATGR